MAAESTRLTGMPARAGGDAATVAELLRRCGARDSRALEQLYALTAPMLLGCLVRILRRRALAEEALQDVFVKIWHSAAQFDEYRGRPHAWLVSIARYRAIDILRGERLTAVDPEVIANSLADETDEAESSDSLGARQLDVLEHCLGRLAPDQAASLRLAYVDGRSHQDIAVALAKPLGSIKSWIRRGLQSLRECLQS